MESFAMFMRLSFAVICLVVGLKEKDISKCMTLLGIAQILVWMK